MESEKVTEKYLCQQVAKLGGIAYKFTSPSRRNVSDRICILPKGIIVFVELKSEPKEPTPAQKREMLRLQQLGCFIDWANTKAMVDQIIQRMKEAINGAI